MQDMIDQIRQRLDMPVVLVGMMGCGKSHIGSIIAKNLGIEFNDSDQRIEAAAGYNTARIFELDGEDKFRKLEARVIQELCEHKTGIIATGGGALLNDETRKVIKAKTLSIWLDDDVDILVERVGKSNKRPLLACGNVKETLENLLGERCAYYEQADITIKSDRNGIREKVENTLTALHEFLYR